jgi:CDP-glycerol glycerophosphotransferase (TagB/SpsB family)
LLESVEAVQNFQPTAIYVPTNWVPDFFPGIKVQVFHGFDVGKRPGTNQDHARIRGLFDLYCTQGPQTTRQFEAKIKKHPYFRVAETGWCLLDPLFMDTDQPTLREQLNTDKPVILYGSTFSPAYSSAAMLADTIEELSRNGQWHWLINLHPKMPQSIVDRYSNMSNENLTFFDNTKDTFPLMRAADAMLSDTSSIFVQYLLLNKPVVTFRTSTPGSHLIDIQNIDEIEPALKQALSRPDELIEEIKEYGDFIHPYRDGKSSERVLQATDDFIINYKGKIKPKPLNLGRKLQMRKKLKYWKF